MTKKARTREPKEFLHVLYHDQVPSVLYGAIQLFRVPPGSTAPVKAHTTSAPFVVAETISPDNIVVLGSPIDLVQDIRRLINEIREEVHKLEMKLKPIASTKSATPGKKASFLVEVPKEAEAQQTFFEYKKRVSGLLILIATQTRNLFQILPHLDRKITLYSYERQPMDRINLKTLFNELVHNRYFYLDGEDVSDLFTSKPKGGAPLLKKFLGYKFNWVEYTDAIERITGEIRIRDFTGWLRKQLRSLSPKMGHADLVSLIQNLYAFSILFRPTNPGDLYGALLQQLLSEASDRKLKTAIPDPKEGDEVKAESLMQSPSISIHEDLSQKKFRVRVNCRFRITNQHGIVVHEDKDFETLTGEVGYDELLSRVDRVFGEKPLIGFKP